MTQEAHLSILGGEVNKLAAIKRQLMSDDCDWCESMQFEVYSNHLLEAIFRIASAVTFSLSLKRSDIKKLNLEIGLHEFSDNDNKEKTVYGAMRQVAMFFCDKLDIAFPMHGVNAFCAIFFAVKGDKTKVKPFIATLFYPAIATAYRLANRPKEFGRMGGRPEHPRKKEALDIARQKWQQMEYASVSVVASTVKHHLEKKYTDAPSIAAIKKWLNSSGIAPNRAGR